MLHGFVLMYVKFCLQYFVVHCLFSSTSLKQTNKSKQPLLMVEHANAAFHLITQLQTINNELQNVRKSHYGHIAFPHNKSRSTEIIVVVGSWKSME